MERSADIESFSDVSLVNTSGGSTSFNDSHEGDIGLGVRPYQFEPEVDRDEEIPPPPQIHLIAMLNGLETMTGKGCLRNLEGGKELKISVNYEIFFIFTSPITYSL